MFLMPCFFLDYKVYCTDIDTLSTLGWLKGVA